MFEGLSAAENECWARGEACFPDRMMQRVPPYFWREAGPFDWTGCEAVEVIVGRLSGVPTLVNTRFSADNLLSHYETGSSARELAADYQLDLEVVTRVLRFAQSCGTAANGTEDLEARKSPRFSRDGRF